MSRSRAAGEVASRLLTRVRHTDALGAAVRQGRKSGVWALQGPAGR